MTLQYFGAVDAIFMGTSSPMNDPEKKPDVPASEDSPPPPLASMLSKADVEFERTKFLIGQKYKIFRLIQLNYPEIDVPTFQLVHNEIARKTYRLRPEHMKYLELIIDITFQNVLTFNF